MPIEKDTVGNVLMTGPDIAGRGGMAEVLRLYRDNVFAGYSMKYMPSNSRTGTLHGLFNLVRLLICIPTLRHRGYRILHVHSSTGKSFYRKSVIILWSRLFGYSIILHWHGGRAPDFFSNKINRYSLRVLSEITSAIIVPSRYWEKYFARLTPHCRVETVYNPAVATITIEPDIISRDRITFLFPGKINTAKGVFDLVEACTRLTDLDGWEVYIAGDGDTDVLTKMIENRRLNSKILIKGWVEGEIKQRVFNQADIVILPSKAEAMPMALLEALACGKAMIGTTVGGIPEIIGHNQNGFLVPPGDVDKLALMMKRYILDRQLAIEHGKKSKEKASLFSVTGIRDKLISVYNSL